MALDGWRNEENEKVKDEGTVQMVLSERDLEQLGLSAGADQGIENSLHPY